MALLVALSATTLCAAVFTGLNRRTWDRRKKVVVLLAGMAAAGLVVAAAAVAAAGRGSPTGTSMPTSAAVRDTSAITPEGLQPQPRALEETLQEITW
ncbi:hypothetical protein [Saccharothrix sp. ALI-22-I]|uniref:hypothetical protein n=1 Tax=Saccharothrix sp. ALI-22-I TaxID=1933778 RepID=UPI001179A856|nr:hypothetical protein [Saccharothrix sp. ALI-22-I]